ncbi:GreA/GreB family elongation factor [Variovorax sp. RA8]|uniref:GreA/GreB family elongation factor n=1 Tax=Variovorax sp. (strain JCM 16519 / RA8) TaxID=662548 RepID=UPI001316D84E|nr:GreA/GreB family elongation factor [Variovorax sp. RA8]VTU25147.1 Regulator of nucleoside diphosphate kinase [Variovorax sp. RA8]
MSTTLLLGERVLTELDHARLSKLLDNSPHHPVLEALLDSTDVIRSREVPADIVTMYSQLTLVDAHTGERRKLTLCYPQDAEPASGFVSVLSPVGISLIGLRLGATANWTLPGGAEGRAQVAEILFQPEASGDYTT